jgi:hypothetical protein
MQKVSSCRGRPRNSSVYRGAQIEVAKAIVEMGRIGANLPRMRAQRLHKFTTADRRSRRKLPSRVSDAGLAEILEVVSDERGIKKLAEGSRPIHPATSASAVQKLIEHGCLPRRALGPIALDDGHARAMKPFAPVLKQLMRVKLGAAPPDRLRMKVRRLVALHRAALVDFRKFESADRLSFRAASSQLRSACLALRDADLSSGPGADGADFAAVAHAAMAVQHALERLVVSNWHLRTPRYGGRDAVRQFVPLTGSVGVPALAPVVAWIQERLGNGGAEFQSAVRVMQEIVQCRWGEDPFSLVPERTETRFGVEPVTFESQAPLEPQEVAPGSEDDEASPNRAQRFCDQDEALISSDPRLGPLYGRVDRVERVSIWDDARADDRFVRRVLNSVDPGKVGAMVLFQFVENWYFDDERGDAIETDFLDRLRAVRVWAANKAGPEGSELVERVAHADARPVRAGETASTPSWSDVKVLLRDLARIDVRSWTEMNVDVPDALPLDQQWWRADAGCAGVVPA